MMTPPLSFGSISSHITRMVSGEGLITWNGGAARGTGRHEKHFFRHFVILVQLATLVWNFPQRFQPEEH